MSRENLNLIFESCNRTNVMILIDSDQIALFIDEF